MGEHSPFYKLTFYYNNKWLLKISPIYNNQASKLRYWYKGISPHHEITSNDLKLHFISLRFIHCIDTRNTMMTLGIHGTFLLALLRKIWEWLEFAETFLHVLVIPRTQSHSRYIGFFPCFFSPQGKKIQYFLMSSVRKLKLKYRYSKSDIRTILIKSSLQHYQLQVLSNWYQVRSNFSNKSDKEFQKTRKLA